ncbi:MAG TPA: helix-turn-helix domain-containing protein [Gammaproteobacteria bacterium]|nr:helix-turn-helix domain-containing protein [Gammaproteobacteria bacterium]
MPGKPRPPRGREAVREALIAAATELFARHGPAAVPVRRIAARAGVNHGLVHRHFGSKRGLLRAVLDRLVQDLARQSGASGGRALASARLFRATREQQSYWRILAHSLLEGEDPRRIQGGFPVVAQMLAEARQAAAEGRLATGLDPAAVVAANVALALGWLQFEPFLLAASELDRRPPGEVRRARDAVLAHFSRCMLGPPGVVEPRPDP